MKKIFFTFFLVLISLLSGKESQQLAISDIHKVMDDIFKQHVSKKEITPSIIRESLQNFIDEFDPERIYFLESEVTSLVLLHDNQILQILEDYKKNEFPYYHKIDEQIKKAIIRARAIRKNFRKNSEALFHKADQSAVVLNEDSRTFEPFAKNEDELKKKIETDMIRFIQFGVKEAGRNKIVNNKEKVLDIYEKGVKANENSYLGVDDDGKALPKDEIDNTFVLHVLKALAGSLDAHTKVMNNNEAYEMKERLQKEVSSVGVKLKKQHDKVIISSIEDNSPAALSGLKLKDEVIKIGDQEVLNRPIDQLIELLNNGSADSVILTIKRDGKTSKINVTRKLSLLEDGRVEVAFDPYQDGIIGKIVLHSFYQNDQGVSSEKDLREAIKSLERKGKLKGLILDLRDNMGGFLNQAVKVTGLFISSGIVVISKYADGRERIYRDVDGKMAYSGPLIILTSKETASAAEIVAESLRDYGVALIVGDAETYGKGTIQSQTVTDETNNSSFFKVTVGKYYTVSGKTPQMRGVQVDLIVPSSISQENIGERYLDNAIEADTIASNYNDQLKDISPMLRPWYMKNYLPKMQIKEERWIKLLPKLKEKSQERISKNRLLEGRLQGSQDTFDEAPGEFRSDDTQMEEAVNIMKDMIKLKDEG